MAGKIDFSSKLLEQRLSTQPIRTLLPESKQTVCEVTRLLTAVLLRIRGSASRRLLVPSWRGAWLKTKTTIPLPS